MNLIDRRQIRIFISSTFKDLDIERNYLLKYVFPELKTIASRRNVSLNHVDLRWGITTEQSLRGEILDVCFREIDNSIPFFIGIVGNRYGWRPGKDDMPSKESQYRDRIEEYVEREMSATEMEIQYGVLERKTPIFASFYLDTNSSPDKDADKPDRLTELKRSIRENGRYPVFDFTSKETLGEMVKSFFLELLDKLFPDTNMSEVELIRINQEAYAQQLRSIYVADENRLDVISRFVCNPCHNQFIITGKSGSGKSSLLSEWVRRNQSKRNIIFYSVGIGGCASDVSTILHHLTSLINHQFDLTDDTLTSAIDSVNKSGKELILIIDAFNQIIMNQRESGLDWFPLPFGTVKFIISTTDDSSTMHQLSRRPMTDSYLFKPFSKEFRIIIIQHVLKDSGKELNANLVNRIAASRVCKNMLVLRVLLSELMLNARHDTITKDISNYLDTNSATDFLKKVLTRYENDYGYLLVRKTLTLFSISSGGFDEGEIMELVNAPLKRYPTANNSLYVNQIHWSRFYCAFHDFFCLRTDGRLGLYHQLMREAVWEKYIYTRDRTDPYSTLTDSLREAIIDKFSNEKSLRAYTELVHQCIALRRHKLLHDLVTSPHIFSTLIKNDSTLLSDAWEELCLNSKEEYPLSECVDTWLLMDEDDKASTYNAAELILAGIIVVKEGKWPPEKCPIAFVRMEEFCIPYQKTDDGRFHYYLNAGKGYRNYPDYIERGLNLLMEAKRIIEHGNPEQWPRYYHDLINCYQALAIQYHLMGNHDEEIKYLILCIEPYIDGKLLEEKFNVFYPIGQMMIEVGRFRDAILYLWEALDAAEYRKKDDSIILVSKLLVYCYDTVFEEEDQHEDSHYIKDNHEKYKDCFRKYALAMKRLGHQDVYESVMNSINEPLQD